jgi:nitric oxide dioxygenase
MTFTEVASPACFMKVISSWETARQRNGFDEQLGIDTLLALFKMDPEIKTVYGFVVDKEVKAQGMQRMGVLIHGLQVVRMFDVILSALGPDEELFYDVVTEMGEQHCKHGLSPDHFTLLCRAVVEVLEKIMGDEWTMEVRAAWSQIIDCVNAEIVKSMRKQMEKTTPSNSLSALPRTGHPSYSLPRAA